MIFSRVARSSCWSRIFAAVEGFVPVTNCSRFLRLSYTDITAMMTSNAPSLAPSGNPAFVPVLKLSGLKAVEMIKASDLTVCEARQTTPITCACGRSKQSICGEIVKICHLPDYHDSASVRLDVIGAVASRAVLSCLSYLICLGENTGA